MSHPIQYQIPFLQKINKARSFDTSVFFYWDFGVKKSFDREFNQMIKWDFDILSGYKYEFLKNYSPIKRSNFFGCINFSVFKKVFSKDVDIALIYGWALLSNWFVIISCLILNKKILYVSETPYNQEIKKNNFKKIIKKFIFKFILERISYFLYIGEENKKFYNFYNIKKNKLFFAPYSVDNERYINNFNKFTDNHKSNFRAKYNLPKDSKIILFVGKLIDKKNPLSLLSAYKNMIINNNINVSLVFVGNGYLKNQLEKYCKVNNLKNVYFLGFLNQHQLPEIYYSSDIFCLPSGMGETWGLVVNEAMCFNLPIVISDLVGSSSDLVFDDYNGYKFENSNILDLQRKLEKTLSNNSKMSFGLNSKNIITKYNYDRTVELIERIISA